MRQEIKDVLIEYWVTESEINDNKELVESYCSLVKNFIETILKFEE